MTRFARAATSTVSKKVPHEATSWQEMNNEGSTTEKTESNKQKSGKVKKKKKHLTTDLSAIPSKELAKSIKKLKDEFGTLNEEQEQEVGELVRKDQRREERRLKRIKKKEKAKVCFNCRQSGHDAASCPEANKKQQQQPSVGTGICFKCGSTEHVVAKCHLKLPIGIYPYATCFICRETGHISSQCPDNPRGLYPNGGACKECGSVEHFRKECPELQKQQGIEEISLPKVRQWESADAEPSLIKKPKPKPLNTGPKIVKF